MFKNLKKAIAITILAAFSMTTVKSPAYAVVDPMPFMPKPGSMVHLSPEFTPAYLKGIVIHPENALKFDFIVHKGDVPLSDEQKRIEYTKLTKYFLASLAIPDDNQWVNLSPYEKDRIIKDDFGKTEMGRDLLAQDYLLKQITASLIYPQDNLGKKFWDRIYSQAQKQFGTSNIPVNTFNKVWILPDDALIYEKGNAAYVLRNHLKVMLEEDYLSLQKHSGIQSSPQNNTHSIASRIVKEIVLPELQREVNEGRNFAPLRQVYSGMLLATWYKHALKESLLNRIYANKSKVKGVDQDPKANEQIYHEYLKAYKKGVFNFIKEDINKFTNEVIPRKYFSGGTKGYTWGQVKETNTLTPDQNAAMASELQGDQDEVARVAAEESQPTVNEIRKDDGVEAFKREYGTPEWVGETPDGRILSWDGLISVIREWKKIDSKWKEIRQFPVNGRGPIYAVAMSPSGKFLALWKPGSIEIWHMEGNLVFYSSFRIANYTIITLKMPDDDQVFIDWQVFGKRNGIERWQYTNRGWLLLPSIMSGRYIEPGLEKLLNNFGLQNITEELNASTWDLRIEMKKAGLVLLTYSSDFQDNVKINRAIAILRYLRINYPIDVIFYDGEFHQNAAMTVAEAKEFFRANVLDAYAQIFPNRKELRDELTTITTEEDLFQFMGNVLSQLNGMYGSIKDDAKKLSKMFSARRLTYFLETVVGVPNEAMISRMKFEDSAMGAMMSSANMTTGIDFRNIPLVIINKPTPEVLAELEAMAEKGIVVFTVTAQINAKKDAAMLTEAAQQFVARVDKLLAKKDLDPVVKTVIKSTAESLRKGKIDIDLQDRIVQKGNEILDTFGFDRAMAMSKKNDDAMAVANGPNWTDSVFDGTAPSNQAQIEFMKLFNMSEGQLVEHAIGNLSHLITNKEDKIKIISRLFSRSEVLEAIDRLKQIVEHNKATKQEGVWTYYFGAIGKSVTLSLIFSLSRAGLNLDLSPDGRSLSIKNGDYTEIQDRVKAGVAAIDRIVQDLNTAANISTSTTNAAMNARMVRFQTYIRENVKFSKLGPSKTEITIKVPDVMDLAMKSNDLLKNFGIQSKVFNNHLQIVIDRSLENVQKDFAMTNPQSKLVKNFLYCIGIVYLDIGAVLIILDSKPTVADYILLILGVVLIVKGLDGFKKSAPKFDNFLNKVLESIFRKQDRDAAMVTETEVRNNVQAFIQENIKFKGIGPAKTEITIKTPDVKDLAMQSRDLLNNFGIQSKVFDNSLQIVVDESLVNVQKDFAMTNPKAKLAKAIPIFMGLCYFTIGVANLKSKVISYIFFLWGVFFVVKGLDGFKKIAPTFDNFLNNVLKSILGKQDKDSAMSHLISNDRLVKEIRNKAIISAPGGIDLNSANLHLQIKRDGKGVPLPISQQNLDNIHLNGLIPVIIDIKPASTYPLLSELQVSKNKA